MGNRISISFKNGDEESVALFSHWGGMGFYMAAYDYLHQLKMKLKTRSESGTYPIDRLEPSVVMMDFIRELTKNMDIVEEDLYLGKDEHDGDNGDHGHFVIDLNYKEETA